MVGLSGGRRVVAAGAAACLFWVAVFLIQIFNWGHGVEKAWVLLALVLSVPVLSRAVDRRAVLASPRLLRGIGMTAAALFALQLVYFVLRLRHPHLVDIATTTLDAGAALRRGGNPYTLPLDPLAGAIGSGFQGYKYLPVMALAYLPLGTALGARGILATNLLLQLAAALLILQLARKHGGEPAGRMAALLYLALPLIPFQLFAKGSTDLLPVVLLLPALLFLDFRPVLAGALLGLSIAAKPVPGLMFLPCLLPPGGGARRHYAVGVMLGLAPILPFVLWSPRALVENIVLWPSLRPPDSTSWLGAMPASAAAPAHAVLLALFLGIAWFVWRRPPSLAVRCGLGTLLTLAAILAGPSAHHNYQLWWLPFYCVLLGIALTRASTAARAA